MFEKRGQALENKFAHDAEIEYKIKAMANKEFGLWAAEKMGLDGVLAKRYAQNLVEDNITKSSEERVIQKVYQDLLENDIEVPERIIAKIYGVQKLESRDKMMSSRKDEL